MSSVRYKSFKELDAIPLSYTLAPYVEIPQEFKRSSDGLAFFDSSVHRNIKDMVFAKGTASILTASLDLSAVIGRSTTVDALAVGETPCSVQLKNQTTPTLGLSLSGQELRLSPVASQHLSFLVSPLGGDKVEVRIGNDFLQIDQAYPFTARLTTSVDEDQINLQQFKAVLTDSGLMSLCVSTDAGWRYLACGSDNVLRATGVMLNQTTVNDYYFLVDAVTPTSQEVDCTPDDEWVAYYMSADDREHNSDVDVKTAIKAPTHTLLTTSLDSTLSTGVADTNICRLRTNFNSKGSASTFNNG